MIDWQPFTASSRHIIDQSVMCVWWIPLNGAHECFVGRAAYWQEADAVMIRRRNGSMVCARPGSHYAVVTPPKEPIRLDDAIDVDATGGRLVAQPLPSLPLLSP